MSRWLPISYHHPRRLNISVRIQHFWVLPLPFLVRPSDISSSPDTFQLGCGFLNLGCVRLGTRHACTFDSGTKRTRASHAGIPAAAHTVAAETLHRSRSHLPYCLCLHEIRHTSAPNPDEEARPHSFFSQGPFSLARHAPYWTSGYTSTAVFSNSIYSIRNTVIASSYDAYSEAPHVSIQ